MLGWIVEVWKAYAHRAATYQTRVLLTLVYFVILGPVGFIGRVTGSNLMDMSAGASSTWLTRPQSDKSLGGLRRLS